MKYKNIKILKILTLKNKKVIIMVKVEVFTSPQCPHCPAAKRVVDEVAAELGNIEVEHVNVMEDPSRAAAYKIMAVPTIVINGEVAFMGAPQKEQLIEKLKSLM